MIIIEQAKCKIDSEEFNTMYSILINAYAQAELEIWGENYFRISKEEYQILIEKKEVFFAKKDNVIVGCIHFHKIITETYSFGLLAVDFNYKGLGIGRVLINHVENIAKNNGAQYMELVILKAKNFDIENKTILKNWYQRLGYGYKSSHTFLEIEPKRIEKSKKLITPSIFDFYRKNLT
ncbi:MAG TPA: N-acetyltransferase [Crocinitomicaceae bacterium]|nr:N-acetyltransferase [Crocinitomicaceae bacterium]